VDPEREEAFRRVLERREPGGDVEVGGETPPQPGAMRTWMLSSWPVRRRGEDEVIGVGAVVVEVTAQREAARALRAQTDRYETLLLALSEVGEGMVVLEQQRLVYANPAFEQLSGYALEELRAMDDVFDLTVPDERDAARERARSRVEHGEIDPHYTLTLRRRDGAEVELEIAGVPLEVDGRQQLVIVGRDITARRRAEQEREAALRRTAFLAEASERFDEVLDVDRMVAIAAELSVRDFADSCTITLQGGAVSASAGVEPEDAPVALMLPLTARGQRIGTMALGFREEPGPEWERELQSIFGDLARRTALALDNARLYQERSAVARTLQRSLLPPELPSLPGMQLAARYVAAGQGNEVGGDFYDCFSTGPGEWALVIGDVCGKGAEAAAITALARYTIRAAVLHTHEPHEVLGELNEAILRQNLEYRFCTVLYAAVRPQEDGAIVRLSSGGHPLPLVVRATGEVDVVARPGTLLGIVADPHLASDNVHLGRGDALVLYTDGVIEATPTDDRFGQERLEEFVAELAGRDAASIASEIERVVLEVQTGAPRDDVAVLVLRVPGQRGESFATATGGVAASA
jgi:PAS domain S-box-containing protein